MASERVLPRYSPGSRPLALPTAVDTSFPVHTRWPWSTADAMPAASVFSVQGLSCCVLAERLNINQRAPDAGATRFKRVFEVRSNTAISPRGANGLDLDVIARAIDTEPKSAASSAWR